MDRSLLRGFLEHGHHGFAADWLEEQAVTLPECVTLYANDELHRLALAEWLKRRGDGRAEDVRRPGATADVIRDMAREDWLNCNPTVNRAWLNVSLPNYQSVAELSSAEPISEQRVLNAAWKLAALRLFPEVRYVLSRQMTHDGLMEMALARDQSDRLAWLDRWLSGYGFCLLHDVIRWMDGDAQCWLYYQDLPVSAWFEPGPEFGGTRYDVKDGIVCHLPRRWKPVTAPR